MKVIFVYILIDKDVGQYKDQSLSNLQVVLKLKSILETSTLKMKNFRGMI